MDLSIPPGLTIIPTLSSSSNAVSIINNISTSNENGIQSGINESGNNGGGGTIGVGAGGGGRYPNRRVLRPRVEARSYAEVESPDINLNNGDNKAGEKPTNGDVESDDDEPMPVIEIKELSAAEIWERERKLRKIREELRNEETKLVLLKKIKHSQQVMKENKTPHLVHGAQNLSQNYNNPLAMLPQSLSKGSLTVIPTNLADYKSSTSISR